MISLKTKHCRVIVESKSSRVKTIDCLWMKKRLKMAMVKVLMRVCYDAIAKKISLFLQKTAL
jgi:hypothetical protein